ncbi:conserved hypothetical protein, partial [Culex quinquefasciatus]
IYRDRERDRSIPNIQNLMTRTVNMSRDQQTDASHGFGICVKGGKDSVRHKNFPGWMEDEMEIVDEMGKEVVSPRPHAVLTAWERALADESS